MKDMRRLLLLILLCGLLACGSSPTAPTPAPTPQPTPQPVPVPAPQLVFDGNGVTFPPAGKCPNNSCEYSFGIRNTGTGCGKTIHGRVQLENNGVVVGTSDWFADAAVVAKPNDQLAIKGCCVAESVVNQTTFVRVFIEAETVAC